MFIIGVFCVWERACVGLCVVRINVSEVIAWRRRRRQP